MLRSKIKKWLALTITVTGLLFTNGVTAFAFVDEAAQQEATESPAETVIPEETGAPEEPKKEETPFSVPGNGQILDDKENDDSKQFLTIQTKSGNTFFLVLDRSSNTENVYMLSMIDENDLADFLEETKEPVKEEPSVVLPETEAPTEAPEPETEPEVKAADSGMNPGILAVIGLAAVGGIGAYYFKVIKPKKAEDEAEDEDLEFYGGGAYINEQEAEKEAAEQDDEEA